MRPEELQMKGGTAEITSQGIAGRMRNAGLWYSDPQNSIVDGNEQLQKHRSDVEAIGKKANFFGNVSRYAWAAAFPALTAVAVAAGSFLNPMLAAVAPWAPMAAAGLAAATIVVGGFWASQKAEVLSVSKQFETSMVNARTTAQEIAKATGKEQPIVVATEVSPRSEARETKWVHKVGHEEPANKNAGYVERYAPDKAAQQSHAAKVEAAPSPQAASIV